jgi:Iron-containing redox enzyme
VPLTEAALKRSRELSDKDPLAVPLAAYLEEHVEEEVGHDEKLLDDLELVGVDRATAVAQMPSPTVAALVGAQYYWIVHHHPVTFLGFVALMEGYPPTPELIETLIERTGFPREAFRTYIEHGDLDPGHRDHLDETLDSLPLTAEHESMLGVSAIASSDLAARALAELLDD